MKNTSMEEIKMKFEFGNDIKEFLQAEASKTLAISASRIDGEYALDCEFITNTVPPCDRIEEFDTYTQDGLNFYVSKSLDLSDVKALRLSVKEFASDLAGRDIKVELVK